MLKFTTEALRDLEDEVGRRLNERQWYKEILHAVELPEHLARSRFPQPICGCTAFVIHGRAAEAEEARGPKAQYLKARAEHEDSFVARNMLSSAAVLQKDRATM